MPTVNWDQFRDGDRIRVTIEGTWHQRVMESDDRPLFAHLELAPCSILTQGGSLAYVTSAELISRPFTPPAAGTLFRNEAIWISLGEDAFRLVRFPDGEVPGPGSGHDLPRPWAGMTQGWLDDIEVLDI